MSISFQAERGFAMCGLACALCSVADCAGCAAGGCHADCDIRNCAQAKGLAGCWQCGGFPCEKPMLQGPRVRAFLRYAHHYGVDALMDRLRARHAEGVRYHRPGEERGDYDSLSEADALRLLHFGVADPYKQCPTLTGGRFTLRLVQREDAGDLLACYGDERALALVNDDNCTNSFACTTVQEARALVDFYLECYALGGFIRFAVVDNGAGRAIGTVEMFRAEDAKMGAWGILRVDVAPAYENESDMGALLALCDGAFFLLFDVEHMLMRVDNPLRAGILRALGYAPREIPGRAGYLGKHVPVR